MKKTLIVILIIVCVLVVGFVSLFVIFNSDRIFGSGTGKSNNTQKDVDLSGEDMGSNFFRNLFDNMNLGKESFDESQKLRSYGYSSGGDMNGSRHMIDVREESEGVVILGFSDSDWHGEDPRVSEYVVSADILDEIDQIVRKYKMYKWNNKEFTDVFVCDGASYSYRFGYTNDSIGFSSQMYPSPYGERLDEIDEVIKKYRGLGTLLPSLVRQPGGQEFINYHPEDGKLELTIYSYYENYLNYRISNGTDTNFDFSRSVSIVNRDTGKTVYESESKYSDYVSAHYAEEYGFGLDTRLEEGNYTLSLGGLTCDFEIRIQNDQ